MRNCIYATMPERDFLVLKSDKRSENFFIDLFPREVYKAFCPRPVDRGETSQSGFVRK